MQKNILGFSKYSESGKNQWTDIRTYDIIVLQLLLKTNINTLGFSNGLPNNLWGYRYSTFIWLQLFLKTDINNLGFGKCNSDSGTSDSW